MRVFNELRKVLLDPSNEAQTKRTEAAQQSGFIKGVSGLAMGAFGSLTVISAMAMRSFPIIGGFFALLGVVGTVASHEAMTVSGNAETMMSSTTARVASAWSEQQFTDRITQDTWVIKPLFGTTITRGLKSPSH